MWISKAIWDAMERQLKDAQRNLALSLERNDRLVEALGRKMDVQIVMPEAQISAPAPLVDPPRPVEEWFKHINTGHKIATPVQVPEKKVSAPKQ